MHGIANIDSFYLILNRQCCSDAVINGVAVVWFAVIMVIVYQYIATTSSTTTNSKNTYIKLEERKCPDLMEKSLLVPAITRCTAGSEQDELPLAARSLQGSVQALSPNTVMTTDETEILLHNSEENKIDLCGDDSDGDAVAYTTSDGNLILDLVLSSSDNSLCSDDDHSDDESDNDSCSHTSFRLDFKDDDDSTDKMDNYINNNIDTAVGRPPVSPRISPCGSPHMSPHNSPRSGSDTTPGIGFDGFGCASTDTSPCPEPSVQQHLNSGCSSSSFRSSVLPRHQLVSKFRSYCTDSDDSSSVCSLAADANDHLSISNGAVASKFVSFGSGGFESVNEAEPETEAETDSGGFIGGTLKNRIYQHSHRRLDNTNINNFVHLSDDIEEGPPPVLVPFEFMSLNSDCASDSDSDSADADASSGALSFCGHSRSSRSSKSSKSSKSTSSVISVGGRESDRPFVSLATETERESFCGLHGAESEDDDLSSDDQGDDEISRFADENSAMLMFRSPASRQTSLRSVVSSASTLTSAPAIAVVHRPRALCYDYCSDVSLAHSPSQDADNECEESDVDIDDCNSSEDGYRYNRFPPRSRRSKRIRGVAAHSPLITRRLGVRKRQPVCILYDSRGYVSGMERNRENQNERNGGLLSAGYVSTECLPADHRHESDNDTVSSLGDEGGVEDMFPSEFIHYNDDGNIILDFDVEDDCGVDAAVVDEVVENVENGLAHGYVTGSSDSDWEDYCDDSESESAWSSSDFVETETDTGTRTGTESMTGTTQLQQLVYSDCNQTSHENKLVALGSFGSSETLSGTVSEEFGVAANHDCSPQQFCSSFGMNDDHESGCFGAGLGGLITEQQQCAPSEFVSLDDDTDELLQFVSLDDE